MSLTRCPDCGKEVSTLAATCPNCGRPLELATAAPELNTPAAVEPKSKGRRWPWYLLGLLGLLWLLGFIRTYKSSPPIPFEILDTQPVYKNNRPSSSGVRMDVLVSPDTTKEQALVLGRYFREKYGSDFIDITIWDSRDSWAKTRSYDKSVYADETNTALDKEIEKVWAKHLLVRVFYNPLARGSTANDVFWFADERDH